MYLICKYIYLKIYVVVPHWLGQWKMQLDLRVMGSPMLYVDIT